MFMDLKQIVERIGIIRTRANLSARALSARLCNSGDSSQ